LYGLFSPLGLSRSLYNLREVVELIIKRAR